MSFLIKLTLRDGRKAWVNRDHITSVTENVPHNPEFHSSDPAKHPSCFVTTVDGREGIAVLEKAAAVVRAMDIHCREPQS